MQFRDIFTKDIMKDPMVATLMAFCLNGVADVPTDITIDEITISLLQHEIVVDFRDTEYELRLGKDIIINALERLAKIRKIEILQREVPYYKIKVRGLQFPILSNLEKPDTTTQIIAIEFDEWKRKDLKFLERTYTRKYLELAGVALNDMSEVAGEKMLHELTMTDYDSYIAHIKKRGICDTSINNYTRALKASLSRAVDKRHIKENPFQRVKQIPVQRKAPLTLSFDEIRYIMEFINNRVLKATVLFSAMCGLRRGEVAYLKWRDVDFENECIHIRSDQEHRIKNNKERSVPLTKQQMGILNELKEMSENQNLNSDYVFPNKDGSHFHENYLLTMLKRALQQAGMDPKINFHTLRRTFATMMKTNGVNINVIRGLLGHSSERTTQRYIGVHEDDMSDAMNGLHQTVFTNVSF